MKLLKLALTGLAALVTSVTSAQIVPPPPYQDCITNEVGLYYFTNAETGSVWFDLPGDPGMTTAHIEGFTNCGIKVLANSGIYIYCSDDNTIQFYARTNYGGRFKFIAYLYSWPSNGVVPQLVIDWPKPYLKITDLKWPEGTNKSKVTFEINAPATNWQYQLWYVQQLGSTNQWIPHQSFYGQLYPFSYTTTAHMTTNRPYGYWTLRYGSAGTQDFTVEDVDPPIGWPVYEICTNCPPGTNGPIPPPLP